MQQKIPGKEQTMKEACRRLTEAIDAYIAKADEDLKDALSAAGFVDPEGTLETAESLEDAIAQELEKDTKRITAAVSKAPSVASFAMNDWKNVQDDQKLRKALEVIIRDVYNDNTMKLATLYIQEVAEDMTVTDLSKHTTNWISRWSKELADLMKLEDNKQIDKILSKALTDGSSVDDCAKAIMEAGIRNPEYRARRAALTEMLRAHNVAHQEEMLQNPCVVSKRWRHSGGYRIEPRQNHVDMDMQVVAKKDPFIMTGKDGFIYYPQYPTDPTLPPGESINCHCIAEDIVDPDILGMSLEEREKLQQEAIEQINLDEEIASYGISWME